MGNRANVEMRYQGQKPVYLYTHWDGENLPHTVKTALKRGWRWDDPAYLARIIFCEIVRDEEGEETGYGISPDILDNDHQIVVVDTENQRIGFAPTEYVPEEGHKALEPTRWWTFAKYIKLTETQIDKYYYDENEGGT